MRSRWIGPDVTESLVAGNQEGSMGLDSLPQVRILPSPHSLLDDTAGVITPRPETAHYLDGKVFIYLDMHVGLAMLAGA